MLAFKLLGEATIALHNSPVTEIGSRTAEALLIYLACEQRPFARTYLAEFFWEERPPDQSAANLRAALSMLRKQLGDYLIVTRQTVAFNRDSPHAIDINEFITAVELTAEGGRSTASRAPSSVVSGWQSAVALYNGDFLDGFYLRESRAFEEWSLIKREQLQQRAIQLLRRLLADTAVSQDVGIALAYANQLLQLNPYSEYAHQQKMVQLARSGQLQAALRHYQACQKLLEAELGIPPNLETTALALRIQRASQVARHNLPPTPTPFVGRERELADLRQQLTDPEARLLTIVGPGGIGKTRLALEAARRLVPTGYFLSGIRFIPLAGVNAPEMIPHLIAAELNISLQGEAPPAQQLAAALMNEEALLVLDNMEHLLEGVAGDETIAILTQLLTAAPLITLLVTSQRRLQLQEEWLFDVSGLSLPDSDDPQTALATDAVRLFLQTAERARRQFQPEAADLRAIIHLCQMLEGLPLAIELAAGWLRHLSCAEIARELANSLELLATDLRNIPARQRSVTAVFDYSWALLPDKARGVLARLSQFRGGFTAAAAKAVAQATMADLSLLLDHSLLRRQDEPNGRYSLHELLRQYAAEQLSSLNATEAVTQAHAHFFFDYLATQADGETLPQRQAIRVELTNIRAAWETAVSRNDEPALLAAAPILHNFYSAESRFHEGIALFQGSLTDQRLTTDDWPPPVLQAELWGRMARLQIHIGQLKAAGQTLDKARAALQQVNDPARQANILGYVAITAFYAGDFARAADLAAESLNLSEQLHDQDGVAFALSFLGSCHKSQGDYTAAANCFRRSVAVYEQLGDDLGKAMAVNNLGNLAQAQGDFAAAQAYYLTCIRLFQENDHGHGAATTLANAGRLARKMGDLTRAEELLQESLLLKRKQQDDRGTAVALLGLADVALTAGDYAVAETYLQEGVALAEQAGDVKLAVEGAALEGALRHLTGDSQEGKRLLAFALSHPALTSEMREQLEPLRAEVGL